MIKNRANRLLQQKIETLRFVKQIKQKVRMIEKRTNRLIQQQKIENDRFVKKNSFNQKTCKDFCMQTLRNQIF